MLWSLYPFLPTMTLPTARSSFTKSDYGTISAHHVPLAREKSLISLIPVFTTYIYILISRLNTILLAWLNDFILQNVEKKIKCICAAYLDSRKKHSEQPHDKTNKMIFAPSEDSDQPGHPPSLIRVFAVRSVGSLGPNVASG